MKAAAMALSLAGLLLAGPLHADPIATLTCKAPGVGTFTAPAYYFSVSNNVADVTLDATTFPTLLSVIGAGTTFTTCVLANSAGSLTLNDATLTTAVFDAAFQITTSNNPFTTSENENLALDLTISPNVAYAAAEFSYSSISVTTAGVKPQPQPASSTH